tara:strand:+ start:3247 stop:4056 length:810 start_codon:yes stop_codon:yes gene_type:complete
LKAQISIIGCGWLGLPLAKHLLKEGFVVKGSTTSNTKLKTLKSNGILPYVIALHEDKISGNYAEFLKGSDTLIINVPPGLRKNPNKNHTKEILQLLNAVALSTVKNMLFISSISVYKDDENFSNITDTILPNANSNSGRQLIEIEKLLRNHKKINTTILRFGGLFDEERHPGTFLSKKTTNTNPEAPINLIHKHDCIGIIAAVLKKEIWNATFNAVYPLHPNKKDYYTGYCLKREMTVPKFNETEKSKGKLIDSSKLVQRLNYTFTQAP